MKELVSDIDCYIHDLWEKGPFYCFLLWPHIDFSLSVCVENIFTKKGSAAR